MPQFFYFNYCFRFTRARVVARMRSYAREREPTDEVTAAGDWEPGESLHATQRTRDGESDFAGLHRVSSATIYRGFLERFLLK